MTVKELYEKVASGKIISDIELQRAIVYDTAKQALVIDASIMESPCLPSIFGNEKMASLKCSMANNS